MRRATQPRGVVLSRVCATRTSASRVNLVRPTAAPSLHTNARFLRRGRVELLRATSAESETSAGAGEGEGVVSEREGALATALSIDEAGVLWEDTTENVKVEKLTGIALVPNPTYDPEADSGRASSPLLYLYRVQWKDGAESTWEPNYRLAEDVLRDHEQRWWEATRAGDVESVNEMLEGGARVLSAATDKDKRLGLHYVCGIGNSEAVDVMLAAKPNVNARDKDGYTPLHISSGYLHADVVKKLVDAGADVEKEDNTGRSPLGLVTTLKQNMSSNPLTFNRRVLLEEVAAVLEDAVYEEVEPRAIVDSRNIGGLREFLCEWSDGAKPMWVEETLISDDLIEDFESNLGYANARQIVDRRSTRGGRVEYLVEWCDDELTWEPRAHVAEVLMLAFEEGRKQTELQGKVEKEKLAGSVSTVV